MNGGGTQALSTNAQNYKIASGQCESGGRVIGGGVLLRGQIHFAAEIRIRRDADCDLVCRFQPGAVNGGRIGVKPVNASDDGAFVNIAILPWVESPVVQGDGVIAKLQFTSLLYTAGERRNRPAHRTAYPPQWRSSAWLRQLHPAHSRGFRCSHPC